MSYGRILWDDENDPDSNVEHIHQHDLTIEDVEYVLSNATEQGVSRSTGHPVVWGYTEDGRYTIVVFQELEEDLIRVITAYEVPEPRRGA